MKAKKTLKSDHAFPHARKKPTTRRVSSAQGGGSESPDFLIRLVGKARAKSLSRRVEIQPRHD